MATYYALIGSWHYLPSTRGYSIYSYDPENAGMELIQHSFEDASIGSQTLNEENFIAYVCDERGDRRDKIGGGGYVLAIRIDPETGSLSLINEKESLSTEPASIVLDRTKKYVIIVHHCDSGYATLINKNENGAYYSEVHFDDAAVVLFPVNEDGSLGDASDISIHYGDKLPGDHYQSRLHSITADPTGELFIICDKGTDKLYSYGLDRENGKLVFLKELSVEDGYRPRYGAFHPTLPIFYFNNESAPIIGSINYDVNSGVMEYISSVPLLPEENSEAESEASDIVIHPNGKYLYVSDRGTNSVSMYDVGDSGSLTLRQNIGCNGENPRGLCLSPDLKFLLVANSDTENISVFTIGKDGTLTEFRFDIQAACPANIKILIV